MRDAEQLLLQIERNGDLLTAFINHQDNRVEMLEFIQSPSIHHYKVLNHRFQRFCFECRFIHYMSKFIYYQSINYIRKLRKNQFRNILDQLADTEYSEDESLKVFMDTEFESPDLVEGIYHLTPLQRTIIHLHYQKGWKLREIAEGMNVSPQSISKTHRRAIDHLKKWMEGEKYA